MRTTFSLSEAQGLIIWKKKWKSAVAVADESLANAFCTGLLNGQIYVRICTVYIPGRSAAIRTVSLQAPLIRIRKRKKQNDSNIHKLKSDRSALGDGNPQKGMCGKKMPQYMQLSPKKKEIFGKGCEKDKAKTVS